MSVRLLLETVGLIVILFLTVFAFQCGSTTTFVVTGPPTIDVEATRIVSTTERSQRCSFTDDAAGEDPNDAFPEFRVPFDSLSCQKIYLDCGSNQGGQLQKLYDGEKSSSPWAQKFEAYFGSDVSKRQKEVCAFAWEPDRLHVVSHAKLRESWAARGIRAVSFAAALDDNNDVAKFYSVRNDEHKNFGSTLVESAVGRFGLENVTAYEVRKFNLRSFLKHKIPWNATVLMKLDIEGTEHTLYPQLYFDGLLCKITFVGMEVHWSYLRDKASLLTRSRRRGGISFSKQARLLKSVFGPSCKVVVTSFDDEI